MSLLPAGALLLDLWLQAGIGTSAPFLPYFPALVIVAFRGGRWPGHVALGLSAAASYAVWLGTTTVASPPPPAYYVALSGFVAAGIPGGDVVS